jgi:hypothetical protein
MSMTFVIYRKIAIIEAKNKLTFVAVFCATLSAEYRAAGWGKHFVWPRVDSGVPRIELGEFSRALK